MFQDTIGVNFLYVLINIVVIRSGDYYMFQDIIDSDIRDDEEPDSPPPDPSKKPGPFQVSNCLVKNSLSNKCRANKS